MNVSRILEGCYTLSKAGMLIICGAAMSSTSCIGHDEFAHMGCTHQSCIKLTPDCTLIGVEVLFFSGSDCLVGVGSAGNLVPFVVFVLADAVAKNEVQSVFQTAWSQKNIQLAKCGQILTCWYLRNRLLFGLNSSCKRINPEVCSSSANSASWHIELEVTLGTRQPFDLFRNISLNI